MSKTKQFYDYKCVSTANLIPELRPSAQRFISAEMCQETKHVVQGHFTLESDICTYFAFKIQVKKLKQVGEDKMKSRKILKCTQIDCFTFAPSLNHKQQQLNPMGSF